MSERAVDLLESNKTARKIVGRLLESEYYRYTYIEGRDAKVGTGVVLRFDEPSDEEVHSVADELCRDDTLDSHIGMTLSVYYLTRVRPELWLREMRN